MNGALRVQRTGAVAIACMLCTGSVFAGRQTLECNEGEEAPAGWGGTIVAQVVNYGAVPSRDPASAEQQAACSLPGPRIRTDSPILRTLIREASERSQTFRTLVAAIDATDGLVYLRVGTCGRLRACLLHRMTLAGEHRVLNILVDLRPRSTDPTPAIGHELQHVLEVLSDSTITTDERIVAFYRFHGRRIRGVLETDAAIRVGDAVRAELRRAISPRSRP
jgi:hypothetical protein